MYRAKGVAGALLTANLQASFRSQLELGMKLPKALLASVNKLFHESTPAEYFATMFFAEYRDQTRELRYINCGHPAALLMRANGKVEHLEATALPIGIFAAWKCDEKSGHARAGRCCWSPFPTVFSKRASNAAKSSAKRG